MQESMSKINLKLDYKVPVTLSKIFRYLLAVLFYYSGICSLLFFVLSHWRRSPWILILTYHRVLDFHREWLDYSQPGMVVSRETFERQMQFLRKKFKVISFDQLDTVIKGRENNKWYCLLTFDDGWRDNYVNAYPILKKFNLPATIFLVTDYIDTKELFWPEKLTQALIHFPREKILKIFESHLVAQKIREMVDQTIKEKGKKKIEAIDKLIGGIKMVTPETRAELIEKIENIKLNGKRRILSWKEILEMSENGIHFGSHGLSHRLLTDLPSSQVWEELTKSKTKIEEKTKQPVLAFSYPNGNYNPGIKRLVKRAGYVFACSARSGCNCSSTDRFQLRRKNPHEDISTNLRGAFSAPMMLFHLTGISQWLKWPLTNIRH